MSSNRRNDSQVVVYPYNWILFRIKGKTADIQNNKDMDSNIKQKKLYTEEYIL